MGEIIFILLLLLTMLVTFCLYKMLDKRGLYFGLVLMNLISFVLTFKISDVFKMNINMAIIPLIAMITIIYIFIIKYGYKEIKNLLLISLTTNIVASLLLATMNFFIPAITETISINMQGTFKYNYKILILYPFIIMLSQYLTIKLYQLVEQIQKNIPICVTLTYVITGLLYTVVFYLLTYIKVLEIKYSLFLGISTYIIGLPLTLISIILINYLTNKKVIK